MFYSIYAESEVLREIEEFMKSRGVKFDSYTNLINMAISSDISHYLNSHITNEDVLAEMLSGTGLTDGQVSKISKELFDSISNADIERQIIDDIREAVLASDIYYHEFEYSDIEEEVKDYFVNEALYLAKEN
jgi:hypothetical protein